jgi:hypothetical protein
MTKQAALRPSHMNLSGVPPFDAKIGAGGKPLITDPTKRSWMARGSL